MYKINTHRGFSIIEALVAITILSFVLTGATTLVNISLRTVTSFRDELTAIMLAQEGSEYVRWRRDTNRIAFTAQPDRWMDFLLTSGGNPCSGTPCYARLSTNTGNVTFTACAAAGCPPLRFNPATGLFSYETSDTIVTSFVRIIEITPISGRPEVRVRTSVRWPRRFGTGSDEVIAEELLLNWQ
jgi:prepilin-type N-terminal cleavage/methylation domain-containing protein